MNLSSKQRAYLSSLASTINPIFNIGKASLTPEIIYTVFKNCDLDQLPLFKCCIKSLDDPREIASVIGERTHSAVVKVIGKKMIFYRPAKKNPKIKLPE